VRCAALQPSVRLASDRHASRIRAVASRRATRRPASVQRSPRVGEAAVRLRPGPHLLIDDELVAGVESVERVVEQPNRFGPPLINGADDHNVGGHVTVVRDEHSGRFRMWYGACEGPDALPYTRVGYIESANGLDWERPHRLLDDPAPIVFSGNVLDEGPNFRPRSKRFKLVWWNEGMWLGYSSDGLKWRAAATRPVLPAVRDILTLFRDDVRRRYIAVVKVDSTKRDGYLGDRGYRRLVAQSVSPDALRWTRARRIFTPDAGDPGLTQFYGIGGIVARGELLIGMLRVLREDVSVDAFGRATGIGYTVLAWSRDGINWQRDREPFLDRNKAPGTWDHAMAWIGEQLRVDDRVYLYYGGYSRGHKADRFRERQLGLAFMRPDRYVARAARSKGELRLRPAEFGGTRIRVNAVVRKKLVVRVLSRGRRLRGYEATLPRGDHLAAPVDLPPLPRDRPLSLAFELERARIYGFVLDR
jgi:hypothetical protein